MTLSGIKIKKDKKMDNIIDTNLAIMKAIGIDDLQGVVSVDIKIRGNEAPTVVIEKIISKEKVEVIDKYTLKLIKSK